MVLSFFKIGGYTLGLNAEKWRILINTTLNNVHLIKMTF
jgi:hypothetical protein